MIIRKRTFKRRDPSRDAKLFVIYCEGKKREPQYFLFFNLISSNIRIEPIPAEHEGNNTPVGLYESAKKDLIKSENNPNPKYDITSKDEVWFVIDTDTWGDKINQLKEFCKNHESWAVAQSNPCFELWLYYHFENDTPAFEGIEHSTNWKAFINDNVVAGGFNSRKHPILIETAISNSKQNFNMENEEVNFLETDLFKLAENFYPLIKNTIRKALKEIK